MIQWKDRLLHLDYVLPPIWMSAKIWIDIQYDPIMKVSKKEVNK